MNLSEFLAAIFDDLTGKDADGRNAAFKEQYSFNMVILTGLLQIPAYIINIWLGVASSVLFARKLQLHLTNQF